MPVVNDLSRRISSSSSRLLLPMSYAAILGGMCTLIGTSTNLIIAELNQQAIDSGLRDRTARLLCSRRGGCAGHGPRADLHGHRLALADPRSSTGGQRQ